MDSPQVPNSGTQFARSVSERIERVPRAEVLRRDDEGFLTPESLVVMVLARVQGKQRILSEPLLLFENTYQRTSLVITERVVACILDDTSKNELYDPLRWQCRHQLALPVEVVAHKENVGLIHLGPEHRDWLYSTHLHPDPVRLKVEVEFLLRESRST
jgi:hypothetical protein